MFMIISGSKITLFLQTEVKRLQLGLMLLLSQMFVSFLMHNVTETDNLFFNLFGLHINNPH